MQDVAPTVIAAFREAINSELSQRNAIGAAEKALAAATVFEPQGRSGDTESEQARLFLLADRAANRWAPLAIATLRNCDLSAVLAGGTPIVTRHDAAVAGASLQQARDDLTRLTPGSLAAKPGAVSDALASLQALLDSLSADVSPIPTKIAGAVVSNAARGLVDCAYLGAAFDGITGEVRETVAVLDALDRERIAPWGTRPLERTASESDLHRELVSVLMSQLALQEGQITHADGAGTLPQPPTIGRHRPDLAGVTAAGDLFLGEAKLGPELFEDHTQEQLSDFLRYERDGTPVVLHLIVPTGWRDRAEEASRYAVGATDQLVIHEVGPLTGASTPTPH